jgi:hypothetical protein
MRELLSHDIPAVGEDRQILFSGKIYSGKTCSGKIFRREWPSAGATPLLR